MSMDGRQWRGRSCASCAHDIPYILNIRQDAGSHPNDWLPHRVHVHVGVRTSTIAPALFYLRPSMVSSPQPLIAQLSADDFGKGYSSLTYLQNYSFNSMKIDKEFVQDMEKGGKGKRLVNSLVRLARDFDLSVIAEGVENEQQLRYLLAFGCHYGQGFYLCPPLPAEDIHLILTEGGHVDFS